MLIYIQLIDTAKNYKRLDLDIEKFENKKKQIIGIIGDLNSEIAQIKGDIDAKNLIIQSITSNIENLQNTISGYNGDIQAYLTQIADLKKKLIKPNYNIEDLQAEAKRLNIQLTKLVGDLQNQKNGLIAKRDAITIEINKNRTLISQIENDIPRLIRELNNKLNECARTQKIVQLFQDEIDVSFYPSL